MLHQIKIAILYLFSHEQICRGVGGQDVVPMSPPTENHKLLYVTLEILVRTTLEKQLDQITS